jgi:hypothetical protein
MNQSQLYQLIRDRAGSKMLRQAEAILNYTEIYGLVMNNKETELFNLAAKFDTLYPLLAEEIPMIPIKFEDIKNKFDMLNLSCPYIHLLETLCADDARAVALIDTVLGTGDTENKKDSFDNFYNLWLIKNIDWTNKFDCWYLKKVFDSRVETTLPFELFV